MEVGRLWAQEAKLLRLRPSRHWGSTPTRLSWLWGSPTRSSLPHLQMTEPCLFLNIFPSASASALPTLARPRRRNCIRSVSTEPSRRSVKQAALKSAVLVSQRATTCLVRQLDLADPGDQIAEEVFKRFADMFKARLAAKTIEAIRSTSRLADDQVTKAAAAMVADEMAAQMELAAS
jgi:hypothetical protein